MGFRDKRRIRLAYIDLFETVTGQIVLEDLAKRFNVFDTVQTAGDPYNTAYLEGQRSAVLAIIRASKQSPSAILQMMEERHDVVYETNDDAVEGF